ncbi:hypothetical protein K7432_005282 [Basidiobolus ranarum]|uniref:Ubiquitin domain-containing protein DSK2 n=1 Tax=Basidiobolus ranarum TaxID=34480 RepID=A0ABR2W3V8_9FUNG
MPEITINIKCSNETKYSVAIDTEKTVLELKEAIAEKSDTPAERQRLIFSGRVLKDADTVESYKIADGNTIHMVRGAAPGQQTPRAAAPQPTTEQQPSNPTTVPDSQPDSQQNANPMAAFGNMFGGGDGLGAFGGMGGFGAGGMGGFGAGAGGMPPMDPSMMNALFSNPEVMSSMSTLFQNPQFVEHMLSNSPQFQNLPPEMRGMINTPQFRQMLSDPNMLRNMFQMTQSLGGMGGGMGGGFGGMNNFGGFGGAPNAGVTSPTTPEAPRSGTDSSNATNPTSPNSGAANPFGMYNPSGGASPFGADPAAALSMLQQMMGGAASPQAQQQNQQPPEERFQVQLQQLNEMGFWDASKNIRALLATGGNVNSAVEWLLSNP